MDYLDKTRAGIDGLIQNASFTAPKSSPITDAGGGGDQPDWKTWWGYTPTHDDYDAMLRAGMGENAFGQSYDQYRALYEALGNRAASGAYGTKDGSLAGLIVPGQVAGAFANDKIQQMMNGTDPSIANARSLAEKALNDYFSEGKNKILKTQTDWRGFQDGKPSPGTGFTNALEPGAADQRIYNRFYDPFQNSDLAAKIAGLQEKNNAIWADPDVATGEPVTSGLEVIKPSDLRGPDDKRSDIQMTAEAVTPTDTRDPFSGIMSSDVYGTGPGNRFDAAPLIIGGNGLQDANTNPIISPATNGLDGVHIIPYGTGTDLQYGTSSNGIPFGFGASGIDTGMNNSGSYNISPGGGLGPGGFDFNIGFAKGGLAKKPFSGPLAQLAGGMKQAHAPAQNINVGAILAAQPQPIQLPHFAKGGAVDDQIDPEDLSDDEIQSVIDYLSSQGQGSDDRIAHINPREAAILKALGGSGTINEDTGIQQFDDGDGDGGGGGEGGDGGDGADGADGSADGNAGETGSNDAGPSASASGEAEASATAADAPSTNEATVSTDVGPSTASVSLDAAPQAEAIDTSVIDAQPAFDQAAISALLNDTQQSQVDLEEGEKDLNAALYEGKSAPPSSWSGTLQTNVGLNTALNAALDPDLAQALTGRAAELAIAENLSKDQNVVKDENAAAPPATTTSNPFGSLSAPDPANWGPNLTGQPAQTATTDEPPPTIDYPDAPPMTIHGTPSAPNSGNPNSIAGPGPTAPGPGTLSTSPATSGYSQLATNIAGQVTDVASSVVDYLTSHGIDPSTVVFEPGGSGLVVGRLKTQDGQDIGSVGSDGSIVNDTKHAARGGLARARTR
jgi:hypothetical protein